MQAMKDMAGQRFGRLMAIERDGVDGSGNVMWRCLCDCGKTTVVRGGHLRSGQVKSCGGRGRGCRRFLRADMTGKVFGRLTVLRRNGSTVFKSQRISRWDCQCQCGTLTNTLGSCLRSGETSSCGCLGRERRLAASTKHGMSGTTEYRLWWGAKKRAKKYGIPFDLQLVDIHIPERCPLLGWILAPSKKTVARNSPTIDRIDPLGGYVKNNVWIISQQANRSKSDLSLEQLKQFVLALERRITDE